MENEITSKDLAKRFEPLKSLYPQRHYNYIHGKSIENFIYHFDNLPSQAKPRVHQALLNYFEHVNSVDITDSSLAQEAFKDYFGFCGEFILKIFELSDLCKTKITHIPHISFSYSILFTFTPINLLCCVIISSYCIFLKAVLF